MLMKIWQIIFRNSYKTVISIDRLTIKSSGDIILLLFFKIANKK